MSELVRSIACLPVLLHSFLRDDYVKLRYHEAIRSQSSKKSSIKLRVCSKFEYILHYRIDCYICSPFLAVRPVLLLRGWLHVRDLC